MSYYNDLVPFDDMDEEEYYFFQQQQNDDWQWYEYLKSQNEEKPVPFDEK